MQQFSYKVNKRRDGRLRRRQNMRNFLYPCCDFRSDHYPPELIVGEGSTQDPSQQETHVLPSPDPMSNSHVSSSGSDPMDNDEDWINEEQIQHDNRPIFFGSDINVSNGINMIMEFYLEANLDKKTINGLLRLIKNLLPKPNRLPLSWKTMNKAVERISKCSMQLLCSDCYAPCVKSPSSNGKICSNVSCKSAFKLRRSIDLIELVPLNIRSQIQSKLERNASVLNKSSLFPPSDICFGERYQRLSAETTNKITLIIHADGAPLVRSSKKSIWPCFASIVELPPPIREFQSNIIVLALWIAREKPNVDVFLKETIEDLSLLIRDGTTVFVDDHEYHLSVSTQFFLSDLPAKALFCRTSYFNGYSACTCCCIRGEFLPDTSGKKKTRMFTGR